MVLGLIIKYVTHYDMYVWASISKGLSWIIQIR